MLLMKPLADNQSSTDGHERASEGVRSFLAYGIFRAAAKATTRVRTSDTLVSVDS